METLGMSILVGLAILLGALGIVNWSIWYERRFAGAMQNRPGPNQVGPFGLLQPIADALKMMQKEMITPTNSDRWLFLLTPPVAAALSLFAFAVIPLGPDTVVADLNIGLLFVLAMGSLAALPAWTVGWASNNKYSLLGAMRGTAQAISYEVPLLLVAMVPVILADSFRLGDIVAAQEGYQWFALWPPGPGLFAFVIFFMASMAEANRIPFDIPEAESELVSGVTTEYTGMWFGLMQFSEYIHTLLTSAIASVLFLGGWEGPGPDGMHWLLLKTMLLFAFIFWMRWTLMRFRSDQLMRICWVYMVPISLGLVATTALWVAFFGGAL